MITKVTEWVVLVGLICVLAIILVGRITTPPEDVIDHGIVQGIKSKIGTSYPISSTDKSRIMSYKVTNSYKKDGIKFYEYVAEVHVIADGIGGFGSLDKFTTLSGTISFQKLGNRWQYGEFE